MHEPTTSELAENIRGDLEREHGWTGRDVSVTKHHEGSIICLIKRAGIPIHEVRAISERHERVDRDGDDQVLAGGNVFARVAFAHDLERPVLDALLPWLGGMTAANDLHGVPGAPDGTAVRYFEDTYDVWVDSSRRAWRVSAKKAARVLAEFAIGRDWDLASSLRLLAHSEIDGQMADHLLELRDMTAQLERSEALMASRTALESVQLAGQQIAAAAEHLAEAGGRLWESDVPVGQAITEAAARLLSAARMLGWTPAADDPEPVDAEAAWDEIVGPEHAARAYGRGTPEMLARCKAQGGLHY